MKKHKHQMSPIVHTKDNRDSQVEAICILCKKGFMQVETRVTNWHAANNSIPFWMAILNAIWVGLIKQSGGWAALTLGITFLIISTILICLEDKYTAIITEWEEVKEWNYYV